MLFDVPTNNKRILDRAKRAPPSDNKIHHGGSSPEAYPVARRKRRKREMKGETGGRGQGGSPGVQNRVPGKALGCNFSRYIRDGSRKREEKGPQVQGEKGRRKAREKSRSRISVHRERRSCLMAGLGITRKGFSNFRKSLRRFLFLLPSAPYSRRYVL